MYQTAKVNRGTSYNKSPRLVDNISSDKINSDLVVLIGGKYYQLTSEEYTELKKLEKVSQDLNHIEPEKNVEKVRSFFDAQKKYQNMIKSITAKKNLPSEFRSVGFEYEFAIYDGVEIASHKKVGKSAPFSELFNLGFELETDTGNILEIGLPPLLMKDKESGINKELIDQWDRALRYALQQLRKETIDESTSSLSNKLSSRGFGDNYGGGEVELKLVSNDGASNGVPNKIKKGLYGIYSQINISLTARESASFIAYMEKKDEMLQIEGKHGARGTSEKGILGSTYKELRNISNGLNEELSVHLCKTLANILAIPDIMNQQSKIDGGSKTILTIAEGYDIGSTVKELHGTWVKAPLGDIVKSLGPVGDVDDKIINSLKKHMEEAIKIYYKNQIANHQVSIIDKSYLLNKLLDGSYTGDEIKKHYPGNGQLIDELEILRRKFYPEEEVEENEDTNKYFDDIKKEIELLFSKLPEIVDTTTNFIDKIIETMKKELANTFSQLDVELLGKGPVKSTFETEEFGSGFGVRKDTHIKSMKTNGKITMNIAELRGDSVIAHFFKFLEEKSI